MQASTIVSQTHVHQVFMVDLNDLSAPRELTHGPHGGTFNPICSSDGKLVAWLEQESEDTFDAKCVHVRVDYSRKAYGDTCQELCCSL